MKYKHLLPAGTFVCAIRAWCDTFDHQTTTREPHALVTVGNAPEVSADSGTLKSLDRLSVCAGTTYRMRPGKHVVVVEFMERSAEPEKQLRACLDAAQAVYPRGVQGHRREVSRTIVVQAGKHYRLVGDRFMPCLQLMS